MKIKVFYPNEKGNIEITKEKLESLLNEAYNEGYRDGKNNNGYYYGISTTPYVSSVCADSVYGSTADTVSSSTTNAFSNATKDLVSTDTLQLEKVSTIDCCYEAITTDTLGGTTNHAIALEYAEVSNEV
jgi:hypothetical protein